MSFRVEKLRAVSEHRFAEIRLRLISKYRNRLGPIGICCSFFVPVGSEAAVLLNARSTAVEIHTRILSIGETLAERDGNRVEEILWRQFSLERV
jgi:hypothetical protein